ncbi:30s ribosomal protein s5 [Plasmopara halstedii]|uniref:30s ribosomal protein s5 n=1 Tax=Plasmopara halstedii TaxID=4781 RepID=A0A0P1A9S6_PLAHL|nr:30s ribosomal protein s5 [Plasmopara halstedii]CEG37374.1 30s ribosomal protein s5 [Plasmopara halstedii]|eukprot:XP_024573743.1 30s ribosomal protein s5 [Plasmopara halstedii]
MLHRFALRYGSAAVIRQPCRSAVAKLQIACYSSEDDWRLVDEDLDDGSDKIIDKNRRDSMPRRQTMPEAAKKSRFMIVSPENRGKVRRRLLDEFKKDGITLVDPDQPGQYLTPDAGVLSDMRAMNKEGDEMEFADEEEEGEINLGRMGMLRQIVHVDQVQKVTTQERIMNFRALVVVGNMRGVAGYAVGKGSSPPIAIERGTKLALKNFTFVDRFDNRTLYHEVRGKWNSCTLFLRPTPKDKGLTVSDTVACVLDCFGITDVVSKTHGQRNPFTVVKAVFDALSKHETAEEIALRTGHSVVEISTLARMRNL